MDREPQTLQDAVDKARDIALGGDMAACHDAVIMLLGQGHDIEDVKAAMRAADPGRAVWNGPIAADAVGERGWPLVEARYEIHSDVYGHDVRLPSQFLGDAEASAFIQAAEDGYDRCLLHDHGHVVVDKTSGKLVFLVSVVLDEDESVDEAEFIAAGERHGASVLKMAWSHDPLESGGRRGSASLTAFVDDSEKFPTVGALASAMQSAAYGGAHSDIKFTLPQNGAPA